MKLPVIAGEQAEEDIRKTRDFYSTIDISLANRFFIHLNKQFKQLSKNPKAFPIIYRHYRRMLLTEFPFAAFYTVEDTHIRILAVLHQKRNLDQLLQNR